MKSLPQTHDIRCPTYRARAATHVQRETSAIPAARVRAPREHATGRFLDRRDGTSNHLRARSVITAKVQLAARSRRCHWVSLGPACGKNWPGRVNGTSSTEQAAASGWLCGDTPSERGPGTSSDRMKRLRSPGRPRIEQPFGVRHAGPATVSEQLCVPKARAILGSFSGAPRRPASSPNRP